jgi:hypothetical protein
MEYTLLLACKSTLIHFHSSSVRGRWEHAHVIGHGRNNAYTIYTMCERGWVPREDESKSVKERNDVQQMQRAQPLLALLGGFRSLGLLCATELENIKVG